MGSVEDCNGGGQAGEPHVLLRMFVTEDVLKPDTSWLKAQAMKNTVGEHSHAQPRARDISISTVVVPTVQTGGRAHTEKEPAS